MTGPATPREARAIAFVDGQNLFHAVREAFGYRYPNYDVAALAAALCQPRHWTLVETCFYTGVPDLADHPRLHRFWAAKVATLRRQGVVVYTRPLRYRVHAIQTSGDAVHRARLGEEKGIDVRIALDMVRLASQQAHDVALLFSQDQDFRFHHLAN